MGNWEVLVTVRTVRGLKPTSPLNPASYHQVCTWYHEPEDSNVSAVLQFGDGNS